MNQSKSLLSFFSPPREDLRGQVCFLSGFSASPDFIEKALENFTALGSLQRANAQSLSMVMFLDKRKKQINGVPGLYHAMLEPGHDGKFSLMHAKVALMTFAKDRFNPIEVVRLVVTTANWTRLGMKENLDLIWSLDYSVNGKNENEDRQRADLAKAMEFFKDLMQWYQTTSLVRRQFEAISALLPSPSPENLKKSRFFTTFDSKDGKRLSMFDSIKERFLQHAPTKPYNLLYCGSGHYESSEGESSLEVFEKIENDLCGGKPFARNVYAEVGVNQKDLWKFKDLTRDKSKIDWNIHEVKDYFAKKNQPARKMLHAKYLLGAYKHLDSLTQMSCYLGSGNLSRKGLLTSLDQPQGNVEAGVVLDADDFQIDMPVDKLLCLGDRVLPESLKDSTGSDYYDELEGETVFASPIRAITQFDLEKRQGHIEWGESPRDCYYMLGAETKVHISASQEAFELPPECELQGHLMVFCLNEERPYFVPIISNYGEYCVTPPVKLDAVSVIDSLLMFPEVPGDHSESDEDGEDSPVERSLTTKPPRLGRGAARTLTTAMELLEGIARKNQAIPKDQLMSWIQRMEFTLTKCLHESEIFAFASLQINFIATLKEEHFAPPWPLLGEYEDLRKAYEASVDAIAAHWGMDLFETFEVKV